jgi:hypothetical protein
VEGSGAFLRSGWICKFTKFLDNDKVNKLDSAVKFNVKNRAEHNYHTTYCIHKYLIFEIGKCLISVFSKKSEISAKADTLKSLPPLLFLLLLLL